MNSSPETQNSNLAYSFAKEWGLVVLDAGDVKTSSTVSIGVRPGVRREAILEARRVLDTPIVLTELTHAEFDKSLSVAYASNGLASSADAITEQGNLYSLAEDIPQTEDLLDSDDDAPVIRMINGLIQEAIKLRASDIHIEPHEKRLSVRFRVDGTLREVLSLSANLAGVLVSRIKVMARLDIAKKRVPQDGRFSLTLGAQAIDVRVSTLPSKYGERAVLRLLSKEQALFGVKELGMTEDMTAAFTNALATPNGIILVTGPTGSGKTTTLYAGLSMLNDASRNILTVEDPIEYALDGIGQTQVNNKVGMTFAAGLRAILRQDPDVVMVGEIRDPETAEIAVQASLTGHLVLSTVHTNSAVAAITRLRDMGIERFLLASTVTAIVAQRLVRRLCEKCKTPYAPDDTELRLLGLSGKHTFYHPKGCETCHGIGYTGRVGLYEMVAMDDNLRAMIHDGAREQDMAAYAFKTSDTLMQSGARHVSEGTASAEEVLRVCRETSQRIGSS
ncbi:MAG: type II secretion system ATPase GspE [Robiginitomaculum sp.]|nr:type II secretion system ATPase GspE [Robiginitomaculum sp.]